LVLLNSDAVSTNLLSVQSIYSVSDVG